MVDDDPGSGTDPSNNDRFGVPGDHIPAFRAENRPMGLFNRVFNLASMGCDGRILPSMAVFLPQSNIFLALG